MRAAPLLHILVGCASAPPFGPTTDPPAVIDIAPRPVATSEPRTVARDAEPPRAAVAGPSEVEIRLHAIDRAGDSAWDDAALEILLESFDSDGSKSLDTGAEVAAIPCPVLRGMDDDLKANNHAGLAVTYGFAPGYLWVGSALGFDESLRGDAYAAMERCGLGDD